MMKYTLPYNEYKDIYMNEELIIGGLIIASIATYTALSVWNQGYKYKKSLLAQDPHYKQKLEQLSGILHRHFTKQQWKELTDKISKDDTINTYAAMIIDLKPTQNFNEINKIAKKLNDYVTKTILSPEEVIKLKIVDKEAKKQNLYSTVVTPGIHTFASAWK